MAQKVTFPNFIAMFPQVTMPITLGEDSHHVFGTENDPLTDAFIAEFIHPIETVIPDEEFTEYIPCFSIADTAQFVALVWWKAELLSYEYVLATFTFKGELISRKVIAGTRVEDGKVYRAVATINEEHEITIGEGVSPDGNMLFDATSSKARFLEILINGEVV
jgi:hypothetical protein